MGVLGTDKLGGGLAEWVAHLCDSESHGSFTYLAFALQERVGLLQDADSIDTKSYETHVPVEPDVWKFVYFIDKFGFE